MIKDTETAHEDTAILRARVEDLTEERERHAALDESARARDEISFIGVCDERDRLRALCKKNTEAWAQAVVDLEKVRAEIEQLREGLRRILDAETHAGVLCGHCGSRIGRASQIYAEIHTLYTQ